MKYLQSLFCWLGVGLIGGMIFLCLQQTPTVPIMLIRLSLLAVPATYAAMGTFGFAVDSNLNKPPTEDENYQWLVYFYPLLFSVSLSMAFVMWFFRVIFEVITGKHNQLPPAAKKLTSPIHKFMDNWDKETNIFK